MNNVLVKKEEFRWSFRKKGTQVINICTRLLLVFGFTALMAQVSTQAYANPASGTVVGGSATISNSGTTETIDQTTQNAIINWNSFNIAKGETTQFLQPNSSATALNRIFNSGELSYIDGNLTANGHVIIINPNGVIIGTTGNINTGGFIATSADIANSSFMNNSTGTYNFNIAGNPNASVINKGTITVADEGLVALVAPSVRNDGLITGNLSTVQLGAADTFGVDLYGDGLVSLAVGSGTASRTLTAQNDGSIITPGGQVLMTAAAASNVVDSVINNSGVIEAQTLGDNNGQITLTGTGANVTVSGTLDVSGANGAGSINIGGAAQGGSTLAQSANVDVTSTAVLNANATNNGNGGNIVVWSQNSTNFQGTATADGGANGGNGGNIETSSANVLNAAGTVEASAPNGTPGTWLLDPDSIDITNSGSGLTGYAVGPLYFVDGGTTTPGTSNLNATTLQNAMNANGGMDVTITTHDGGNITVDAPLTATQSWVGLYLNASGNIVVNQAVTAAGTNNYWLTPGWNNEIAFSLNAGGSIQISAPIVTNGNSFLALAQGNITDTSTINTGIGAAGIESVNGNVSVGNITTTYGSIGLEAANGTVTAGNLTMDNTTPQTGIPLWTGPVGTGLGPVADTMLLIAKNGITTGNLTANSGAANAAGVGQIDTITLTTASGTGNITTGSLDVTNQAGGTGTLTVTSGGTLTVDGDITGYNRDVNGGPYAAISAVTLSAQGSVDVTGGIAVSALDPITCCVASNASLNVTSANGNVQIGNESGTSVSVQSQGIVNGTAGGATFADATSNSTADITANKGSITLSGGVTATADAENTTGEHAAASSATTNVVIGALNDITIGGSVATANTSKSSTASTQTSSSLVSIVSSAGDLWLSGANPLSTANTASQTDAYNGTAYNETTKTNSNQNVAQLILSGTNHFYTLTYNANDATTTYGTAATGLTGDVTGFVQPGQTESNATTGTLKFTTTATNASNVGQYAIDGSGLSATNYVFVQAAGNAKALTIDPATLTIDANAATKTYGTNDPTLTYSETGLVNGNTISGALTTADYGTLAGEQVGNHAITLGTLNAGSNYTIDYVGNNLSITPATLTVAANSATKTYGSNDPTLTYASTGLVDKTVDGVAINDSITGNLSRADYGTLAGEQAGSYAITTGSVGTTALNANDYNISVVSNNAALTITPASLTVAANSASKTYGTSDPTLAYTSTGLVNKTVDGVVINDSTTGVLSRADYGTLAGEQVGSYAITLGSVGTTALNANDYNISVAANSAALTINAATLTIAAASDVSKTYGTSDPTLSYVSTGLVNTTVDGVAINNSITGNVSRADYGTLAGEQAGSYAITTGSIATTALNANDYNISVVPNSIALTITPATLTVAANDASKTYGTSDPTLTYTSTGLVNTTVDGVAINDTTTGALSRADYGTLTGEQVGSYAITTGTLTTTALNANDYNISLASNNAALAIDPAALTVAINNASKTYGTSDPTLTYTSTGLVNTTVDGVAINDGITGNASRADYGTLAGEQVGSYAVTVGNISTTALNANDYNISVASNNAALTITPATLTVAANDASKTYGTSDPTLTYTSTGLVNTTVDGVAINDTTTGALSRADYGTLAGEQVGSYAITTGSITTTALNANDYNISLASNNAALTINQATLTVAVNDASKTYGTSDPTLTYTSTGLVNTTVDGVAINDGITGNASRADYGTLAGEQVGSYAVTVGNIGTTALNANDYNISVALNNAALTITPATLTVAANDASKTYGTSDPTLTYTSTGLVNTTVDGVAINDSINGSLSRADYGTLAGEQVGSYTITTGSITTTALNANDYNISLASNNAALTVNPATLAIAANDASKTYGTNDPTLTYTSTGLVNTTVDGVAINDSITGSLSRADYGTLTGEQVGSYAITTGSITTTALNANDYNISFANNAALTINPATLTVAANGASKIYGTSDPTLTYTSTGLVNTTVDGVAINDTTTGALSRADYGTLAGEQVGSYAINIGTLTTTASNAGDYTIALAPNNAALAINPASLTVTANNTNVSKTYGTSDPTLAYTSTGLVNTTVDGVVINDSITGVLSRADYGTLAGEQVGSYAVTLGSLGTTAPNASDYNITLASNNAALTINPTTLTVAANNQTITQGQTVPAGTVSYSGFVNGVTVDGVTINDSAASLTKQPTVTSAETGTPAAGTYANDYTASGAVDPDYTFAYTAGSLSVSALPAQPNASIAFFGTNNFDIGPLGRPIISVADQVINFYAPFEPHVTNPENINIGLRDENGGQGGSNLANIEPAAGGNDNQSPNDLANIEPAAGGNGPGPQGSGDFSCAKDFLDGKNCTAQ